MDGLSGTHLSQAADSSKQSARIGGAGAAIDEQELCSETIREMVTSMLIEEFKKIERFEVTI